MKNIVVKTIKVKVEAQKDTYKLSEFDGLPAIGTKILGLKVRKGATDPNNNLGLLVKNGKPLLNEKAGNSAFLKLGTSSRAYLEDYPLSHIITLTHEGACKGLVFENALDFDPGSSEISISDKSLLIEGEYIELLITYIPA